MYDLLKSYLTSKKAVAMMAGVIVAIGGKYGLELETESLIAVLSPIVAYIIGQGLADAGKEAVKIESEL